MTNDAGNTIAINTYDEFGIPGPNNLGRFQYTGQKWLPILGLYDYKARTYSPTLGRFMQTDPIGYAAGLNWYNYVSSDPINNTDPSGLEKCPKSSGTDIIVCGKREREQKCAQLANYQQWEACEAANLNDNPGDEPDPGDPLPQKVTVGRSCAGNPVANDPAVQSQALKALRRSVSGNSAGTAEWGFLVAEPYVGSGNWVGPLFTEGHQREVGSERITREAPLPIANLLTGYYPTSTFVHAHPNNKPPSPVDGGDLTLGRPVIAIDKAGNMTCAGR